MTTLAFFSMPRGPELLIIALVALLIFGRKLPELGRSLGKGIVEFKKGLKGMKDELDEVNRDVSEAERQAELDAERAAKLEARKHEAPPQPAVVEKKTAETVAERAD